MSATANASEALQRLTQYAHRAWRVEDGLVDPAVIGQSPDGYLWIGTASGLLKFDGMRFTPVNAVGGVSIAGWSIDSILFARDGSVWIGTLGSASRIRGSLLTRHEIPGRAVKLVEDADGNIWTGLTRATGNAPLCRISAAQVECYGPPEIPLNSVTSASFDGDGMIWLGGSEGYCHWARRADAQCYLKKELAPYAGTAGVNADLFARDGMHWVGITQSGKGLGLGRIVNDLWEPYAADGIDGTSLKVTSLIEDREGSLWIGTVDQGVYRIHDGKMDHFGSAEGLSANTVGTQFEDREGVVWVATSEGLDSFRKQPVSVFSTREGLPADGVESLLATRGGPVWVGNWELSILESGVSRPPPLPDVFRGKSVTSLLEDRAGRIWVGLDKTLNVFEHNALRPITADDGSSFGLTLQLAEDASGDVWAVLMNDVVRIHDFKVAEHLDRTLVADGPTAMTPAPNGGLWFGYANGDLAFYKDGSSNRYPGDAISKAFVRSIVAESNGVLMSATDKGLLVQDGASRSLLDIEHGLPCEKIGVLLRDGDGDVWLKADCGLVRLRASDLAGWIHQPELRIRYTLLDALRGVRPGTGSFTPAAMAAPDGRLWFATRTVAEVVDPRGSARESTPAVIIEQITADRVVYPMSDEVVLPPNTRDLDIGYTAPTSVLPQALKFRYQLEGRDSEWEYADTRRRAFYTDLPPGNYRFIVQAARTEGDWSGASANLAFSIPPLYYQTRWFAAACAAGILAAIYCAFRLRLRQLERNLGERLKARSQERERIARDLHDTLLQDTQALVLGFQTVADEMAQDDPARRKMEATLDRADRILAEGRACVLDLRTSEATSVNLPDALSRVGEEMAQLGNQQKFSILVEGSAVPLAAQVRDECYRIGREAILNSFRHADARAVEVQIIYAESFFSMHVRDDGKGIDQATLLAGEKVGHWGLLGMRERAKEIGGVFQIWSGRGEGTEIQVKIPATVAYRARLPLISN